MKNVKDLVEHYEASLREPVVFFNDNNKFGAQAPIYSVVFDTVDGTQIEHDVVYINTQPIGEYFSDESNMSVNNDGYYALVVNEEGTGGYPLPLILGTEADRAASAEKAGMPAPSEEWVSKIRSGIIADLNPL